MHHCGSRHSFKKNDPDYVVSTTEDGEPICPTTHYNQVSSY